MNAFKYNLIRAPKHTVNDYLQSLNNDELLSVYSTSFSYSIKIPDLIKKMQKELQKRNMPKQLALL